MNSFYSVTDEFLEIQLLNQAKTSPSNITSAQDTLIFWTPKSQKSSSVHLESGTGWIWYDVNVLSGTVSTSQNKPLNSRYQPSFLHPFIRTMNTFFLNSTGKKKKLSCSIGSLTVMKKDSYWLIEQHVTESLLFCLSLL